MTSRGRKTYNANRETYNVQRITDDLRPKVLILGLGSYPQGSGVQAAIYYAKRGAEVLVTDNKTALQIGDNVKTLKYFINVKFHLGTNKISDVTWADVIVRNPGVPRTSPLIKEAEKLGKPIVNDITIFLEHAPCLIVGVTGTRGKSTTTAWTGDMLKRSDKKVYVGGNITVSPLTFLDKIKKEDVAVIELSSWLLEPCGALGLSPHIAVWTNLLPDHLNTYDGMDDYAEAKAQIMRNQNPDCVFVANLDDSVVASYVDEAPSQAQGFSLHKKRGAFAWTVNGWLVLKTGQKTETKIIKVKDLGLKGEHNIKNALGAVVAAHAAGATIAGIRASLGSFGGVPYRQQIVAIKRDLAFVNDTTSTTPDAAIAALNAFVDKKRTAHWICGGAHKGLDFDALAKLAGRSIKMLDIQMLDGTAFVPLSSAFKKYGIAFKKHDSLKQAFDQAVASAKKGDVILLSPACASFGMFKNEFDRGDQFNALVEHWAKKR